MQSASSGGSELRTFSISTAEVAPSQRIAFWNERFVSVWGDVSVEVVRDVPFFASLTSRAFGDLRFNEISTGGQRIVRRPLGDDAGFYSLAFPVSGAANTRLGSCTKALIPGNVYLLDNREPGELLTCPAYVTSNVQIPVRQLERRLAPRSSIVSVPLSAGGSRVAVLRDYVISLKANAAQISPSEVTLYARQLCELVAFMIDGSEGLLSEDSSVMSAHRRSALAFIAKHYAEDDLSPDVIAAACGISRPYLHRVFRASGRSVMDHVRQVRLERARDMLESPLHRDHNVAEIGFRCGFNSASDFSRAFKQMFGSGPREYRARN